MQLFGIEMADTAFYSPFFSKFFIIPLQPVNKTSGCRLECVEVG